jgi:hypothetical protein
MPMTRPVLPKEIQSFKPKKWSANNDMVTKSKGTNTTNMANSSKYARHGDISVLSGLESGFSVIC